MPGIGHCLHHFPAAGLRHVSLKIIFLVYKIISLIGFLTGFLMPKKEELPGYQEMLGQYLHGGCCVESRGSSEWVCEEQMKS